MDGALMTREQTIDEAVRIVRHKCGVAFDYVDFHALVESIRAEFGSIQEREKMKKAETPKNRPRVGGSAWMTH